MPPSAIFLGAQGHHRGGVRQDPCMRAEGLVAPLSHSPHSRGSGGELSSHTKLVETLFSQFSQELTSASPTLDT